MHNIFEVINKEENKIKHFHSKEDFHFQNFEINGFKFKIKEDEDYVKIIPLRNEGPLIMGRCYKGLFLDIDFDDELPITEHFVESWLEKVGYNSGIPCTKQQEQYLNYYYTKQQEMKRH